MSLYKRRFLLKDGRQSYTWAYDFVLKGRRYRGSFGKMTTTTAKALYARARQQAMEGHWQIETIPHSPTLEAFIPEFLAWYQSHSAEASVQRYRYAALPILEALGRLRLSEITDPVVDRYMQARRQAGRAAVTVNREVGFLRHVLTMGVRWKRLGRLAVSSQRRLRELGRERILSDAEEVRLLRESREPLRGLIQVGLDTGFRESELVALRRPMAQLSRGLLTVPSAYAKSRETRTLEMTRRVAEIVADRLRALDPQDVTTPLMGYRQASSVKRAFRQAANRAGLPDVRFHDLRHTFATRLILAGVSLAKVQRLMGHKSLQMTMRYLRLTDGDLRGAIQVLNREALPTVFPTSLGSNREVGR